MRLPTFVSTAAVNFAALVAMANWIPAFAGMTKEYRADTLVCPYNNSLACNKSIYQGIQRQLILLVEQGNS
jgi:glutamate-1-semialdehyde aminotransferase